MRRWLSAVFLVLCVCAGCGGGGSHGAVPGVVSNGSATRVAPLSVATGPVVLAVNAGGPATGGFAADEFFVGYSGEGKDSSTIDAGGAQSAPAAIYATYRTAPKALTATVTGLAPFGSYTGYLYFEEPLLGGVGRRVMNVSVGGIPVATGLDIYAQTQATHKAYNLPISGVATASGTLDIVLTATANDAILSGFMLQPASGTVGLVDVEINSGGPATAAFAADRFYTGYSGTNADNNPIDVSNPNVAPAAVYASYRTAPKTIVYNVVGLAQDATYNGFVYLEEPLLGGAGRRVESIYANAAPVVLNYDIFKAAGKTHKALAVPLTGFSDATGTLTIEIDATVSDAIVSGFALHEAASPLPTPSGQTSPPPSTIAGTFTRFTQGIDGDFVPGIAAGPDGALWFTEGGPPYHIGRITTGGTVTTYPIGSSGQPGMIVAGPDGAMWFTDVAGNAIGRINTAGTVTEFRLPRAQSDPEGIAQGSDGALWFTEGFGIGRMTTNGVYSEFALPASGTQHIAAGPDGALWFTETGAGKIGRITTGGVITEFQTSLSHFDQIPKDPIGIAPGPDGAMWFGDVGANAIGRITTSGSITEFPVPNGFPDFLAAGPDGAMYIVDTDVIARVTTSGVVTNTYAIPTSNTNMQSVTLGSDGALWFGEGSAPAIERLR